MTNTNWDELKEAIKIFKVDGMSEHQFFLYVKSLLEQEKIKWLEALPKERDDENIIVPEGEGIGEYRFTEKLKIRGWNKCLETIKQQLTK